MQNYEAHDSHKYENQGEKDSFAKEDIIYKRESRRGGETLSVAAHGVGEGRRTAGNKLSRHEVDVNSDLRRTWLTVCLNSCSSSSVPR